MSKVIKLTESDLQELVKRVIEEQTNVTGNDRIANIASVMNSLKTVNKPTQVIVSNNPKLNNMTWNNYIKTFKVTPFEIAQAKQLSQKMGVGQPAAKPAAKPTAKPAPKPAAPTQPTQQVPAMTGTTK